MYYADHEDQLVDAPQLAILDVLDAALDRATATIVVTHPEIQDADGFVGLPPDVWVADALARAMRDLQRSILLYREAALDDAHYRARHLRRPVKPPDPSEPAF